jgi:hypothetical protein
MKRLLIILLTTVVLSGLFLMGCASSGDGDDETSAVDATSDTTSDATTDTTSGGYVITDAKGQMGPVTAYSTATLQSMNAQLKTTGDSHTVLTYNDRGHFEIDSTFTNRYILAIVEGAYYNENENRVSGLPTKLVVFADLSVTPSVIANPLTTIIHPRVVYLIKDGESFADAKAQAETEVRTQFGVTETITDFELADITVDDARGGLSLSIAAIIQQDNADAESLSLMGRIAIDMEADGDIDSSGIITELYENAKNVDAAQIKQNIEAYYGGLGVTITVTKHADYIDSDGDGVLNAYDDDEPAPFSFAPVVDADLEAQYESNSYTVSGLCDGCYTNVTGEAYLNGDITSDFKISNGDVIKLISDSSPVYSSPVNKTIIINGTSYSYIVTTIADARQQIIVFDSGQPAQNGDFGASVQSWCESEASSLGLPGTIIPYLSISGDLKDSITQDPINPRQVQSLNGGLIASEWSMFFKDEGNQSFDALGVVDGDYWTGTMASNSEPGELHLNCGGWTSTGNINPSDNADYNIYDVESRTIHGDPRSVMMSTCDQLKKILCIAY